jgi:hypothetical protein
MKRYWVITHISGETIYGWLSYGRELFYGTKEEAEEYLEASYGKDAENCLPFDFPEFIEKGESGVVF